MRNLLKGHSVRSEHGDPEGHLTKEKLTDSVKGILKKAYGKITTLEYRRKTFLIIICVVTLTVDPLFLFVPEIDGRGFCVTFHKTLAVSVCVIRTVTDTFYFLNFIVQSITSYLYPSSRESILHKHKCLKMIRHLFYFICDIFSVLPIPQIIVLRLVYGKYHYHWVMTMRCIKWIILAQYMIRIFRMYPLYKKVTGDSGRVAETKWIGAVFNLLLYILHSYVFGAFWYVNAVEKQYYCWRQVCSKTKECNVRNLYCGHLDFKFNGRFLENSCPLIDPEEIIVADSRIFNFGIYIDAIKSRIVEEHRGLFRRIVYSFWWGLRNISAFGQNLKTSYSVKDVFFAIIICVSGMLLFGVLIGNVQKYLQPTTLRADEMEEKRRDMNKWMTSKKLPRSLKARIKKHEDEIWRKNRGINEDSLLHSLPEDIRLETERYINKNMSKPETNPPLEMV